MFVYRTVFIRVIGLLGASSDLSLWGYLSDRWPDSDWPSSRWLAVKSVVIVCNRNRIIDRSPFRPNPCTLPASRAPLRCRLIKKSLNRCRNYTGKYIHTAYIFLASGLCRRNPSRISPAFRFVFVRICMYLPPNAALRSSTSYNFYNRRYT